MPQIESYDWQVELTSHMQGNVWLHKNNNSRLGLSTWHEPYRLEAVYLRVQCGASLQHNACLMHHVYGTENG